MLLFNKSMAKLLQNKKISRAIASELYYLVEVKIWFMSSGMWVFLIRFTDFAKSLIVLYQPQWLCSYICEAIKQYCDSTQWQHLIFATLIMQYSKMKYVNFAAADILLRYSHSRQALVLQPFRLQVSAKAR